MLENFFYEKTVARQVILIVICTKFFLASFGGRLFMSRATFFLFSVQTR